MPILKIKGQSLNVTWEQSCLDMNNAFCSVYTTIHIKQTWKWRNKGKIVLVLVTNGRTPRLNRDGGEEKRKLIHFFMVCYTRRLSKLESRPHFGKDCISECFQVVIFKWSGKTVLSYMIFIFMIFFLTSWKWRDYAGSTCVMTGRRLLWGCMVVYAGPTQYCQNLKNQY